MDLEVDLDEEQEGNNEKEGEIYTRRMDRRWE